MSALISITGAKPKFLKAISLFDDPAVTAAFNFDHKTKGDIHTLIDELHLLFPKWIARITKFYNWKYQLDYSEREVELLLYRPLTFLLRQYLGSYYILNHQPELFNNYQILTLREKDYETPNSDHHLTAMLKHSEAFSLQIISTLVKNLGLAHYDLGINEFDQPFEKQRKRNSSAEFMTQFMLYFTSVKRKLSFRKAKKTILKNNSYVNGSIKGNFSFLKLNKFNVPQLDGLYYFKHNLKLRQEFLNFTRNPEDDILTSASFEVLSHALPRIYLEGIKKITNDSRKSVGKIGIEHPSQLFVDRLFYVNERFSITALIRLGVKLIYVQHGSVYGESKLAIWENSETKIADFFLTWGWKKQDNHIPFITLKFNSLTLTDSKERTGGLLWLSRGGIGNLGWEYLMYHDYFKVQEEFYNSLSEEIKNQLVLRLLITKFSDRTEISKWRNDYPTLKIDYMEEPLSRKLNTIKMAVIDYFFSTAFVECILTNTPVIIFENNLTPTFTEQAEAIFQELHRVGVVHFSHDSASAFLNKNYDSINEWWNSAPVKNAIADYSRVFANITLENKFDINEITRLHTS